MNKEAQFVSDSIEAMLVAIAEGVRDAQEALNAIPAIDAFGRALPTYHLPFLDFTIAVSLTTQTTTDGRPIARLMAAPRGGQSSDLRSSISGRLVASPPGEGLPTAQLTITGTPNGNGHRLRLTAINSAGEILSGQKIELNIDPAAGAALSGQPPATQPAQPRATLQDAIVVTDADGVAETSLTFGAGVPPQTVIVVVALLGSARASAAVIRP